MTQSVRDFDKSFVCGSASLITKQFYIVKQDTDGTIILSSAATDKHLGVLLNKPAVGAAALVRLATMGTVKVVAGGTITVGAWVTSDSNGKAVATTTNKDVVIGKFLGVASAASGDIIEVQLSLFTLSS